MIAMTTTTSISVKADRRTGDMGYLHSQQMRMNDGRAWWGTAAQVLQKDHQWSAKCKGKMRKT